MDSFRSLLNWNFYKLIFFSQTIVEQNIFKIAHVNSIKLDLVTTQGSLLKLPSSFYNFDPDLGSRYMFWYSDNSYVFQKKEDVINSVCYDYSRYLRDYIDVHFCWTESWSSKLREFGVQSEIKTVGSLLLYPRNTKRSKSDIDLLILDTPFYDQFEYKFYATSVRSMFYNDVQSILLKIRESNPNARIYLKSKRSYVDFVTKWCFSNSVVQLNTDSNLYSLISKCSNVIGLPLSSPVIVAKEIGINAIYYYPDERGEWIIPRHYEEIPVITKYDYLLDWVSNLKYSN